MASTGGFCCGKSYVVDHQVMSTVECMCQWILRENRMVDRCVRKDSSNVLMHLSTIRFSFYAMVLLNLCI